MSEPTAAQQLHDAAAKLRGLAQGATPGPLVAITDNGRKDGMAILGAAADRGTGQAIAVYAATNGHRHGDAKLAATLDSRAALALADSLDAIARHTSIGWEMGIDAIPIMKLAQLILEAK